jgi:hypothetical protein
MATVSITARLWEESQLLVLTNAHASSITATLPNRSKRIVKQVIYMTLGALKVPNLAKIKSCHLGSYLALKDERRLDGVAVALGRRVEWLGRNDLLT